MTWAEFDAWSPRSRRGFAAQQVAAGLAAEPQASALAEKVFAGLLPEGLATPGHLLWSLQRPQGPTTATTATTVGHLWLLLRPLGDGTEAYVMDLEVLPEARRRGLARAAMLAAEQAARDLGATEMRLNVFAHNVPAVRLYDGLGYRASLLTLTARLPASSGPGPSSRPEPLAPDADGLWTAKGGELPVARLGLELEHRSDGVHAFAHVVEGSAGPDPRRAEAVLGAAHRAGAHLGAARVSVAVPGPAVPSGAGPGDLYERTGFRLTATTLWKAL
jgi:ribosomal protein S18 acetylase RimI-like enzyme